LITVEGIGATRANILPITHPITVGVFAGNKLTGPVALAGILGAGLFIVTNILFSLADPILAAVRVGARIGIITGVNVCRRGTGAANARVIGAGIAIIAFVSPLAFGRRSVDALVGRG
jgi:hypothetical protein